MTRSVLPIAVATIAVFSSLTYADEPQLSHNVYFKLRENSEKSARRLMSGCRKYLADHEGTEYFSVGVRAKDVTREVNDEDFDVALTVVFRNREAHDKYQSHPRHLKFIEEHKDLWEGVRVFDSLLPIPEKEARETGE